MLTGVDTSRLACTSTLLGKRTAGLLPHRLISLFILMLHVSTYADTLGLGLQRVDNDGADSHKGQNVFPIIPLGNDGVWLARE